MLVVRRWYFAGLLPSEGWSVTAREETVKALDAAQRVISKAEREEARAEFDRAMAKIPDEAREWALAMRDQVLSEGDGQITPAEFRTLKTGSTMAAWFDALNEVARLLMKVGGAGQAERVSKLLASMTRLASETRAHTTSALESARARRAKAEKPADPLEAFLVKPSVTKDPDGTP